MLCSMGQLAIVNAPSTFTAIWAIMKPWLSKETADKVDILGSNYKDVLLKLVDADCLPSTLGGTCECPEYGGCHMNCPGPWLEGRVGWGRGSSTSTSTSSEESHLATTDGSDGSPEPAEKQCVSEEIG